MSFDVADWVVEYRHECGNSWSCSMEMSEAQIKKFVTDNPDVTGLYYKIPGTDRVLLPVKIEFIGELEKVLIAAPHLGLAFNTGIIVPYPHSHALYNVHNKVKVTLEEILE